MITNFTTVYLFHHNPRTFRSTHFRSRSFFFLSYSAAAANISSANGDGGGNGNGRDNSSDNSSRKSILVHVQTDSHLKQEKALHDAFFA
jgi:hypothetical protein